VEAMSIPTEHAPGTANAGATAEEQAHCQAAPGTGVQHQQLGGGATS